MIIEYVIKKHGKINTQTMIRFVCDKCDIEYSRKNRDYLISKKNKLYDKDYCRKCFTGIVNSSDAYKKNMSKAINKMYKDRPEIRDKKRKSMKGKNKGAKNAAKRPEVRKKMSVTRTAKMKDPKERLKCSKSTARAWKNGKFDGVKVGYCKWYDYKHSNGNIYKVQGTWELAFIEWLDKNNIKFRCHRGRLPYRNNGCDKSYYPDFWIDKWDCYVDVKCKHFYIKEKFEAIEKCGHTVQVLFKKDLLKLGVKI